MKILAFTFFLAVSTIAIAQPTDQIDEAFSKAKESQKPILLIFSGSDWCAPCIKFQNTVLTNEQFQQYALDHFIILKVDFPQRKKLDKSIKAKNEELAEKYNPKGQFPYILLLRPDQTILSILYYKNQQAEEFISELSTHFSQ